MRAESKRVFPVSRVSRSARFLRWASMSSPSFQRMRPRREGAIRRQSGLSQAPQAASTARSTSAAPPAAISPWISSVEGSREPVEAPEAGSTQSPPMKWRMGGYSGGAGLEETFRSGVWMLMGWAVL